MSTFAMLLLGHRNAHSWSQQQLARRAGVDHSYVCRLEGGMVPGSRQPARRAVFKLANSLRLTGAERIQFLAAAGFVEEPMTPETCAVLALLCGPMDVERRDALFQAIGRITAQAARDAGGTAP